MSFDEPRLRALVRGDRCVLRPQTYFVAWNGVLTLVYDGFPPVLAGIKARLNAEDALPPENFGSRWPKTTLAALRDDGDRPIDIVLERLHDRRRWIARGARRKRRLFEADDVPHHAYCGCGGDWPRCADNPANYSEP